LNHEKFIRTAIKIAADSRQKKNHPFGALLVKDGKVLIESENTVVTSGDVTQHAELNLVSRASQKYTRGKLAECTLYASTEPCAMCAGAIYWSGIRTVVFGMPGHELAHFATGSFVVDSRELLGQGRESTEVIGPYLLEESRLVHENFWG